MKKTFIKLTAEADHAQSLPDALRHAAEQIEEGFTSGDLRTDGIEFGSWEVRDSGELTLPNRATFQITGVEFRGRVDRDDEQVFSYQIQRYHDNGISTERGTCRLNEEVDTLEA